MPIVNEDVVKKDISSSDFSRVYLIYGDDLYLKKYYCDGISDKAYGGDPLFNLQKFECEVNLQDVYDAVNQFPMMADSKCVVLTDYDFEYCSESEFNMLCELIKNVDEGCVFVLRFEAIDFDTKKSERAKRLFDSTDSCGGKVVCLNHKDTASLVRMLISGASKRGCTLSDSDARYFVENVGDDLSVLKSELDKLCNYVDNGKITKEIIDKVAVKSTESTVYEYVQEILKGNISSALKMLDDLFYMRVEPMIILYTTSAAYVDMYRVYASKKANAPIETVANDFSYQKKFFVLEKAKRNLNKVDFKKIVLSFDALLAADEHLKNFGYDPRTVLECLTVKLVYIIVKGESID